MQNRQQANEKLVLAAWQDNLNNLIEALEEGADPNYNNHPLGASAIYFAVINGSLAAIYRLIMANADVNLPRRVSLVTPLMRGSKDINIIRALLAAGANVNARSAIVNQTALIWAIMQGADIKVIQLLLKNGANPLFKDGFNKTAADYTTNQLILNELHSAVNSKVEKAKEKHKTTEKNETPTFQKRLEKIGFKGEIPAEIRCHITLGIMNDPVTVHPSGLTYDREVLKECFEAVGHAQIIPDPITRQQTRKLVLDYPTNITIKNMCEAFVIEKEIEFSKKCSLALKSVTLNVSSEINKSESKSFSAQTFPEQEKMRQKRIEKLVNNEKEIKTSNTVNVSSSLISNSKNIIFANQPVNETIQVKQSQQAESKNTRN